MAPPRPTAGSGGYSLLEIIVALAIAGIVLPLTASLIVAPMRLQSSMAAAMEKENVRSLIRQKLRCDQPCSQNAAVLPTHYGSWDVTYNCSSLTMGISPMMQRTVPAAIPGMAGKVSAPEPVFEGEGYPCQARLPGNCVYGCHWNGEIGDRGYLYPPLMGKSSNFFLQDGQGSSLDIGPTTMSATAACIQNDFFGAHSRVVGVDFATGRVICADDQMFGPSGPLCKTWMNMPTKDVTPVKIVGTTPCTQYSQYGVENAVLSGELKIQVAAGFVPSRSDRFVIVIGNHLSGRFSSGNSVVTKDGIFFVSYGDHTVTLSGYTPKVSH